MFREYFEDLEWKTLMPGIRCCFVTPGGDQVRPIPLHLYPDQAEIFFCIHGELTLRRRSGQVDQLGGQGILLLSDCSHLASVEVGVPLEGICLAVDCQEAENGFSQRCQSYGDLPMTLAQVRDMMRARGGLYTIFPQIWTRSAFHALECLPPERRGNYCVMKCFELLYLLCMCQGPITDPARQKETRLAETAEAIQAYLTAHLNEKLTISELSRRFHLSPTACKNCFRACFGQSIHHWLLTKRLEVASELLTHSTLSILQIAQAVGYEGNSQFNAAFKKKYGMSPRDYRNHVQSR